jgi:adenylate kinase
MLAERLGVPHIASGNLLREAMAGGTELGRKVQSYVDRGDLVPDEIVIGCMQERLIQPDAEGFVLDGFPRTSAQALALDRLLNSAQRPLDIVVLMKVDENELVLRITGRRTCPTCQRSYHMVYNKPVRDEVCDDDGTKLETRADDTVGKFQHRLDIYRREARDLKAYYEHTGRLYRVDGTGPLEEVAERLYMVVETPADDPQEVS